jgi:hypothetical protein
MTISKEGLLAGAPQSLNDLVDRVQAEIDTLTGLTDGLTATEAEINKACDLSAQIQTLTASGAITAGVQAVYLNHATVAIASTIANAALHQGLFLIKAGLEPGAGQDHTCTITTGTWNGTNKVATFADIADSLLVYFDAAGNGTILVNTGSVAISG